MVKNELPDPFGSATLPTTGDEKKEQNKHLGQVSIMKLLTGKDDDFLSYFDKIDVVQNGIEGSLLKRRLIDIHDEVANRGKLNGHLPLEHFFGFC